MKLYIDINLDILLKYIGLEIWKNFEILLFFKKLEIGKMKKKIFY